jgi:hypothetical protein
MIKNNKKAYFTLSELKSAYKSITAYKDKKIVINSKEDIEDRMGQFGNYLMITLANGDLIAVSSSAIIDIIDRAIKENKFPFSATVVEKTSKKNKDRKYFTLV